MTDPPAHNEAAIQELEAIAAQIGGVVVKTLFIQPHLVLTLPEARAMLACYQRMDPNRDRPI